MNGPLLLIDAFEKLYRPAKLSLAAPKTIHQHQINNRRFSAFLDTDATIEHLTDANIRLAEKWLSFKLAPASLAAFRKNHLSLWRFLARREIVETWPELKKLVPPRRIPRAWTVDELGRLWDAAGKTPGFIGDGDTPARDWWPALLAVLWDTGERVAAVMLTEWDRVDMAGGWIVIRAEVRKGRRDDVLSKLHPDTVELLSRIHAPSGLVFPFPTKDTAEPWRSFGRILERAGLPNGRMDKFHKIRKSVATHLTAAGGNAQRALGHRSPWMTISDYIDPRIAPPAFPSDILFRPSGAIYK